jgi:hypothetical protein
MILPALASVLIPAGSDAAVRGPDAFGYQANDRATYSLVDISATGGVSVLSGADDDQVNVNIGFAFTFYGQTYSSLCINSNGVLLLGACNVSFAGSSFANTDLTGAAPLGNPALIAAYWTDLTFSIQGAGSAYYQLLGSTPGLRRFVVEWKQAYPQNGSAGITFEAILYEGSNQILLQYQNTVTGTTGFDQGAGATVGVRGTGTGQALQWSYDAAVIPAQYAILVMPPSATYSLTIAVNPPGAGSVTGAGQYASGSVQQVSASASNGYVFSLWSGDASGPSNPASVVMGGPRYVVANFMSAGQPQLTLVAATTHSAGSSPGTWVIPFTISNGGNGGATGVTIVSISNIQIVSGAGTVTVASTLPLAVGSVDAGKSVSTNVIFNWPTTALRVRMTVQFSATGQANLTPATLTINR